MFDGVDAFALPDDEGIGWKSNANDEKERKQSLTIRFKIRRMTPPKEIPATDDLDLATGPSGSSKPTEAITDTVVTEATPRAIVIFESDSNGSPGTAHAAHEALSEAPSEAPASAAPETLSPALLEGVLNAAAVAARATRRRRSSYRSVLATRFGNALVGGGFQRPNSRMSMSTRRDNAAWESQPQSRMTLPDPHAAAGPISRKLSLFGRQRLSNEPTSLGAAASSHLDRRSMPAPVTKASKRTEPRRAYRGACARTAQRPALRGPNMWSRSEPSAKVTQPQVV